MTTSTKVEQLIVHSPDGVRLAVWVEGEGSPLVLVHGSIQDHTVSWALVEALRSDFTTYAMDRRGFGASGDSPSYSLDREFADVAAVVDEVAARSGSRVALWGHSFGAGCAMGAAALTANVSHLLLYEPGLGLPYPAGWVDEVERLVADGDLETAIVMVLRASGGPSRRGRAGSRRRQRSRVRRGQSRSGPTPATRWTASPHRR
jgi:alpha-beta hydrolase superfamily lysophospholipase